MVSPRERRAVPRQEIIRVTTPAAVFLLLMDPAGRVLRGTGLERLRARMHANNIPSTLQQQLEEEPGNLLGVP